MISILYSIRDDKSLNILNVTLIGGVTRNDLVPMYAGMITFGAPDNFIVLFNKAILSKWKPSGLEYIKDRAWKLVDSFNKR